MVRSIVFPRVLGRSLEDLQPALELLRALGFATGNEWHEGGNHGIEMLAPSGGVELIGAMDAPGVDAMVEVSDADAAWEIVRKLGVTVRKDIGDTAYGARLFEVEVSGLRVGFLTYAKKSGDSRGVEGKLDGRGKKFAIVVSRFNSFITGVQITFSEPVDAQTVNAVGPGPNDTGWIDDDLRAELLPRFPMGRLGRPEDAAALVAWLCSEEAAWVTGQVIHSEGGFLR